MNASALIVQLDMSVGLFHVSVNESKDPVMFQTPGSSMMKGVWRRRRECPYAAEEGKKEKGSEAGFHFSCV